MTDYDAFRSEFEQQVQSLKEQALFSTDPRVIGKLIALLDEGIQAEIAKRVIEGSTLNHVRARISATSADTVEVRFEFGTASARVNFAPSYLIAFVDARTRRVLMKTNSIEEAERSSFGLPLTMLQQPLEQRRSAIVAPELDRKVRDFLASRLPRWPIPPGDRL